MDDDPEDLGTVDILRDAVADLRAAREFLDDQGPSAERDAVLTAVKESLAALLRVLPKDEGRGAVAPAGYCGGVC